MMRMQHQLGTDGPTDGTDVKSPEGTNGGLHLDPQNECKDDYLLVELPVLTLPIWFPYI